MKRFIISILIFLAFLVFPSRILAQEYSTQYLVEYFLNDKQTAIQTEARFTVTITNLQSDVYVKKFTLSFPKSFAIDKITARDDFGVITPEVETDNDNYKIALEFSNPRVGRNSKNTLYLTFNQNNLFNINGNVWEVILPTIENKGQGSYKVVVHLPETGRRISIAKPKPTTIQGNQIIWENPQTKTIYAVFGDTQGYDLQLKYHLQNKKISPVYTDIAFPPDALYQKIYVDSITPQPALTYTDEDGNFVGRYFLNARETKSVSFKGFAEIFSYPRPELLAQSRSAFQTQKSYLLNEDKHWKIDHPERFDKLTTIQDIYYFLVQNFKYNYAKIGSSDKRLGANEALKRPDQAVCVEFSDAFVALAREKGFYTREIQGYGFSNDEKIRPLSLVSDVLHSWQEYYDTQRNLWIPVDSTWENTSGIDYFTSFDLNHIAFAIHGKSSEYPLPAGLYKTNDTRDLSIIPSSKLRKEAKRIHITSFSLNKRINDLNQHKAKVRIKNEGNVHAYDVPLSLISDKLTMFPRAVKIPVLAPGEEKEVIFEYKSTKKNVRETTRITALAGNLDQASEEVVILPYYYNVAFGIALSFLVICLLILFMRKTKSI